MSELGERMVAFRKQQKISRKNLAEACGGTLTESKIWSIENGRAVTLEEEAGILGVIGNGTLADPDPVHPRVEPATPTVPWSPPAVDVPEFDDADPMPGLVPSDLPEAPQIADLVVPSIGGGPVPEEGVRLVSNSELQTFKDCRRKWWLGWYRGLKLNEQEAFGPRIIGERLHRALAMYYVPEGTKPMDPRAALERFVVQDWSILTEDVTPTAEFTKKFNDQTNLERAIIEGYLQWIEENGEDTDLEIISPEAYMEAQLEVNLGGLPYQVVKLIGRLDARARRRSDGHRQFVDHKIVGEFTRPSKRLPLDEQMLSYHLLEFLNLEDSDERCDGALYNMLRRVRRTVQAKPPFFKRIAVHHNQHELYSIKRRIEATVSDILSVEQDLREGVDHRDTAYPRPSDDCSWKCPFVQVCPMFDDGSRAEDMLTQYYHIGDPLDYYKSKESVDE